MGPKRKLTIKSCAAVSPIVKKARQVTHKYKAGYPKSPTRVDRVRKALKMVTEEKVSIRKAARTCDVSFGFLHRRLSGTTDIDTRNGPSTIFPQEEEAAMATWLSEMAKRGMGLKPKEFLEHVQDIVTKEKRTTPFKDGKPSYDWYYAFMARNNQTVSCRREVPLEMSRSKLTCGEMDQWFSNFREFLISKQLLDKPGQIWNADECGFTMGSKAGKVIGPVKRKGSYQVPHVTGGSSKKRLTAMYCCNADGEMMPPFLVYPSPQPKGCNPLNGASKGTVIHYTKKGWMTTESFWKFIDFLHEHAGPERPQLLLIDSVSSHVDMTVFQDAMEKGIEIYRLVPNATHLLQPLDRGVFGPLKVKWYQVLRRHYRDHPGSAVSKANFAEKLRESFNEFYKPSTIINSFKATGIYPVERLGRMSSNLVLLISTQTAHT